VRCGVVQATAAEIRESLYKLRPGSAVTGDCAAGLEFDGGFHWRHCSPGLTALSLSAPWHWQLLDLYDSISFSRGKRASEIGVRMAFGGHAPLKCGRCFSAQTLRIM